MGGRGKFCGLKEEGTENGFAYDKNAGIFDFGGYVIYKSVFDEKQDTCSRDFAGKER